MTERHFIAAIQKTIREKEARIAELETQLKYLRLENATLDSKRVEQDRVIQKLAEWALFTDQKFMQVVLIEPMPATREALIERARKELGLEAADA